MDTNINDLNGSLDVLTRLNKEQLNSIYAGAANSTTVPQAFRNKFTKQDLLNFIDETDYILHPFLLFGTKDIIDKLGELPDKYKVCYIPDGYMKDDFADKVVVIDRSKSKSYFEPKFYYSMVMDDEC